VGGAANRLEQADVECDGESTGVDGMVKLATLFDPDGNARMRDQDLSGDA